MLGIPVSLTVYSSNFFFLSIAFLRTTQKVKNSKLLFINYFHSRYSLLKIRSFVISILKNIKKILRLCHSLKDCRQALPCILSGASGLINDYGHHAPTRKHSLQIALYTRGVYFLVKDYWGCAAGWGCIFTTRLTIMGLHF